MQYDHEIKNDKFNNTCNMHGVPCSLCYDVSNSDYIALNWRFDDGLENNVAGHSAGLTEVFSCFFPWREWGNFSQDRQWPSSELKKASTEYKPSPEYKFVKNDS